MYKINNGLKEWHLNENEFKKNLINKCIKFNIPFHTIKFYSQQDEDKYIIQYILKDKLSDGVYFEVGGCDGILYSNTKTLEDYFGFSGILIEPQLHFFEKSLKNRPNNECYNYAISNSNQEYIEFIGNNAEGGIVNTINTNIKAYNWNQTYQIENKKCSDILNLSKFNYIDIMIIDVEGGELELLKSIDFSFPIYCIIIEAHSKEQEKNAIFGKYLSDNGFSFHERQRGNEVWFNKNYFRRHLFQL